ncbi:hypothetical protein BDW02DRAFT_617241, partial [Decorospora gaudefroyi]
MRLNRLTTNNWQVITKYIDVLSLLKECTKRLKSRGKAKDKDKAINDSKPSSFGAIAKIILVFKYLLTTLESRLQSYN